MDSHAADHAAHTPDAVRLRLNAPASHSYLRDFVYGAVDGAVTTFAVVSAVAGARLPPRIVLILGPANVVADGFSMAVSNYLGTRAERQLAQRARRMEELHIAHVPDGEREEVRQIYAAKGFAGDELERIVAVITADRERWVDAMLRDELGLPTATPSPARAASATFAAFMLAGLVPLVPFVYELLAHPLPGGAFLWSTLLTALVFLTIGAVKGKLVDRPWLASALETLAVGGAAAALAYYFAMLLRGIGGAA